MEKLVSDWIVLFLENEIPDEHGRKLSDYWNYGKIRLEAVHTYIQRMFPLDERSSSDSSAPVLTEREISSIKSSDMAIKNIRMSYEKMLNFWQLDAVSKDGNIDWRKSPFWLKKGNHNFKRMTRVLKCLQLLGQDDLYNDFLFRLNSLYAKYPETVGEETAREYWKL